MNRYILLFTPLSTMPQFESMVINKTSALFQATNIFLE